MHSYLSKDQKKTLLLIKKKKIVSLQDFYKKILLKDKLIKPSLSSQNIDFYVGNKNILIGNSNKIYIPVNISDHSKLILIVREFADLWKYLESERLIYCQDSTENIVFICKSESEVFKEILYPIKDILNKQIVKSTRLNDFDGLTINETIQKFEKRIKIYGLLITILIPFLTFFLDVYKEAIINYINMFIAFLHKIINLIF